MSTEVKPGKVYVRNLSELQLPRIIALDPHGVGDLMPGHVGPLTDKALTSPAVNIWMKGKRLEIVTEQDYIDFLNKTIPKVVVKASEETPLLAKPAKATKLAKPIIEKLEDGSTAISPAYDEIPEAEEIPEPTVANLDKDSAITLVAPKDSQPLTEEAGDPIKLPAKDLRPRVLDNDGGIKKDKHGDSAVVAPQVTQSPAPAVAAQEAANTAEKILAISNWRKQRKEIESTQSIEALRQIQDKVTVKGVKEAVVARIEALSKA